jgi:CheY-like chemotaxis protein
VGREEPSNEEGRERRIVPARLLVVDDNETNRDLLGRKLRRLGYEVTTADGGAKALATVAGEPVDLVVLDIMMPGIDGVEVLRRLRRERSAAELPVIMASARSDSRDIVECAELGANDHIGKPIDFDVLSAKIRALLRLKAAAAPKAPAAPEPAFADLGAGSVLAGRYRLGDPIGAGNFGTVYRARHLDLDLEVAIKVLKPSLSDAESLSRFRQEGVAACRVRHPNAVLVTDFGVTETGVAYLVMEILEGVSLDREMSSRGKLAPARVDEILQPVLSVLAEAHAEGLVHRDVKPENVFLHAAKRGEVVKVLDFGIAKLVGAAAAQGKLTAAGWFVGTPAYTAPERLAGAGCDGRADVYSVGVMAFEMLTGQRPFTSRSKNPMLVLTQHAEKPPPTLRSVDPDVPRELEEPIARALEKDPAKRPDAATFAEVFGAAVAKAAGSGKRKAGRKAPAGVGRASTATAATLELDLQPGKIGRLLGKLKRPG